MATHVVVQLGAGGFDSEAKSLIDMLIREFEYEYCSVRAQFITGMLTFLLAQGLRVRYSLRRYADLSYCAMFCLFSAASGMLSYNNAHTVTFGGYPGLVKRWARLSAEFYCRRMDLRHSPMALMTVGMALLGLIFLCRGCMQWAAHGMGWEPFNDSDSSLDKTNCTSDALQSGIEAGGS